MHLEAITKPYVDYKYYQSTFKGTKITSKSSFIECEREAEAELDKLTFHRIPKLTDISEELVRNIRFAVCSMAEVYSSAKQSLQTAASGIAAENRDGYSVSYGSADKVRDQYSEDMKEKAWNYLLYTGLFYRGGGSYAD